MAIVSISKRPLKNVGENIWNAISVMEGTFGAQLTHDSGHGKGSDEKATTWIFDFPRYGNAQIAVPMNKQKLSLLMRSTTLDGRALEDHVGELASVERRHTNPDNGVASSVLGFRAPFLNPSPTNPLLRVVPRPESVGPLLALYLGRPPEAGAHEPAIETPAVVAGTQGTKRAITADDLQRQLDRKSEIGSAGELIAVTYELDRLRKCGCENPERMVERVALTDVGCGYDIASTWPGEERFIEVKSTTRTGSDFFITENEWQVLHTLGEKAWLYRVVVDAFGGGEVVAELRDPTRKIEPGHKTPAVWRVAGEALCMPSTTEER